MKKVFLFCAVIGLTAVGCSQFDQFALKKVETTEVVEGEVEVPVLVTNMVEQIQETGSIEQVPVVTTNYVKQPYRIELPVVRYEPSATVEAATDGASFFGPWGTLIGAVVSGALTMYARNKNRTAKQKAMEVAGLAEEKSKLQQTAKVVISNVSDALDLLDDLDKSSDGTLVKKYLAQIKRKQEELNVRGIVDALRKGS